MLLINKIVNLYEMKLSVLFHKFHFVINNKIELHTDIHSLSQFTLAVSVNGRQTNYVVAILDFIL